MATPIITYGSYITPIIIITINNGNKKRIITPFKKKTKTSIIGK